MSDDEAPAWRDRPRPGAPRYLDLPAPPTAPTPAWVTPLPCPNRPRELLASPLGLALPGAGLPHVLDPLSGQLRAQWAFPERAFGPVGIRGDVLILHGLGQRLWGLDLLDGQRLHETRHRGEVHLAGDLVLRHERLVLEARRLTDPRRPPRRAWRREVDRVGCLVLATPRLALLHAHPGEWFTLDAASGEDRFASQGRELLCADDAGLIVRQPDGRLALLDLEGRVRWRRDPLGDVLALGPGALLAASAPPHAAPAVIALERETGRELWRRGPFEPLRPRGCALLRDAALLLAGDTLIALELDRGDERWRVDLAAHGLPGTTALAPLGRRVFGVTDARRAFCLRG